MFNHAASWVPQLRDLTLSAPLTVQDALNVLSQTMSLERLVLWSVDYERPLLPHPVQINLPRLVYIQGTDHPNTMREILEHITPSPICELVFETMGGDRRQAVVSIDESMAALIPLMSGFVESFFSSRDVSECHIKINLVSFSCTVPSTGSQPPFTVSIRSHWSFPPVSIFPAIHLKTVTKLDFTPWPGKTQRLATSELIPFVLSLTSVQTLRLSYCALELIDKLGSENRPIFPTLRTLQLKYDVPISLKERSTLVTILSRRKYYLGPEVTTFDLSEWTNRGTHWGFLEISEDLKVVWNTQGGNEEYICGSGQPERLDFR